MSETKENQYAPIVIIFAVVFVIGAILFVVTSGHPSAPLLVDRKSETPLSEDGRPEAGPNLTPATTATPPAATATPPAATATPHAATATPHAATATPHAATATPHAATDTPPAATATPHAATDTPPAATDAPPEATATPPAATDTPPAATATPPPATATPLPVTGVPPPATATPPAATATPPRATGALPGAFRPQTPGAFVDELTGLDRLPEGYLAEGLEHTQDGLRLKAPTPASLRGVRSGTLTSPPKRCDLPGNSVEPMWKGELPKGTSIRVEVSLSPNGVNWSKWIPIEPIYDKLTIEQIDPDGVQNPGWGYFHPMKPAVGMDLFESIRYRITLRAEPNIVSSPLVSVVRLVYIDTTVDGAQKIQPER